MEHKDFITGAIIGGCLGGLAALLMTPKSGDELRNEILNGYNTFTGNSQEKLNEVKQKTQCLIDSIGGGGHDYNVFLLGGLAGTVLGAISGLLLAPQSGNKLREKLGDEYDSMYGKAKGIMSSLQKGKTQFQHELEDWKEILADLVEKISKGTPKNKSSESSYLDNISDWASLGLRLYREVQNRR